MTCVILASIRARNILIVRPKSLQSESAHLLTTDLYLAEDMA